MNQSKNILLYKLIGFIILLIILIFRINFLDYTTKFKGKENTIYGYIESINIGGSKITLILKSKEKILVNYFDDDIDNLHNIFSSFCIGDYVKVDGIIKEPSSNTNFYLFDYKQYLKYKNIYYIFNANKIELIKHNNNIFYDLKQKVIDRASKINYSSAYINSFVLGDDSFLVDEEKKCYRNIGISHLFAISGMHIGLLISILSFVFRKFCKSFKFTIIFIFLLFYLFLIGFSVTAIRASIQALYLYLNKKNNFFSSVEIILLVFFTISIYNPNYLFFMSFQISIIVSFFIALFSRKIKNNNFFISTLYMSFISFVSTFPIIIYYFNSINLLSIFINVLFVPVVSYILFPLCIITFLFPVFDQLLFFLFSQFYNIALFFSSIKIFILSFPNVNIIVYIIYYIILMLFSKYRFAISLMIVMCVIHYNIMYFNSDNNLYFFDVGQGDSSLFVYGDNKINIMVDTGGKDNCNFTDNIFIPFFNKVGVKKIDYLILTHGDYDHMGEAINLVNNFKVEKVIFNCGPNNDLESELIKVLDKKKIKYYSCIKELNIDKNKLNFLQTKEYDNENDNSNVIYTELDGYKFMFMGDTSSTTEKEILSKYNLPNIDVLKVGHHGSKTSSSEEFVNVIDPKYSIISVGKNNRYGHPNKEVLNNLENSKIYRTDQDGSIMFKIKNNKLKIETCNP